MAKKKPLHRGKTRTREHIIADLAVNHVERQVLLRGFTMERMVHDYGLDAMVFEYNTNGEPQPELIYLQVKATERASRVRQGQAIAFRLERSHLQAWLREPLPIFLCVYDVSLDSTYWLYIQQYFEGLRGFNLFRAPKKVTVRIPVSQSLTPAAVGQFAVYLEHVRQQRRGGVHHE
jgi:hypothetical protein